MNITELADRARSRWALTICTAGALVLALAPATAGAQQVTDAQYNSTLQLLQSGGQPPPGPTSNGLPFTGLDVVAMLAVGLALAAAGFLLWRRSRSASGEVGA